MVEQTITFLEHSIKVTWVSLWIFKRDLKTLCKERIKMMKTAGGQYFTEL